MSFNQAMNFIIFLYIL